MSEDSSGSSDSSDDEASCLPRSTDALESALFANYPLLKEELPEFCKLTRQQKLFVYLLGKNPKESTHVEYKTSVCASNDWRFRLLRSACAMYNGLDPDLREPSLTDSRCTSSYLVFGVKERDRKSCDLTKNLVPLDKYPGEEEIQDCFRSNTMPFVKVYFHLVRFESERHFRLLGIEIPAGIYALLEIPKGEYGPVLFRDCSTRSIEAAIGSTASATARSPNRSGHEKGSPGFLSYTRTDAQNVPADEWNIRGLHERVYDQFQKKYNFQGLFMVKEDLILERNSFRVLAMSKFTGLTDPKHKEVLSRALGQGKWDVIIDFDRESREQDGHFTFIEEEMLKQGRLFSVKSWKELSKTDPKDMDECQRGQRTIYLQVMGCTNRCILEPTNSNLLKKLLKSKFLEVIFEKNHSPRPVMCVTLCLTATTQELLSLAVSPDKVAGYVKKAFIAESDNDNGFKSATLCTEEVVKQFLTANGDKRDKEGELTLLVPPNQLCFLFASLYSSSDAKTSYELPGVSGPFSISREQFATYRPYLRLYHAQSGQSKYLSKSEDQRKQYSYDIRREFLAGNELTKGKLHVHDELQFQGSSIYVERREMSSLKEKVSKSLAHCNDRSFTTWHSHVKQIIRLCHEPASGATTIARIVLWRQRNENPCVEVKSATRLKEAIEGICTIYEASKLPVLILFDSNEFLHSTVYSFVSELNRMRPITKSVVIFVEKVHQTYDAQSLTSPVLTVKLSGEETAAFEKIYQESGGDKLDRLTDMVEKETDKTPFLFGVWHFKQDYKKINEFIIHLLSTSTDEKKKLLYFASLTQLFTHSSLHLSIAAQFFGMPPEQKDPGPVLQRLGIQRHLLIVRKQSGIWGLTPIFVVGEKILDQLFSESDAVARKKEQIHRFVGDLCEMGENGSRQQLFCLQSLVQQLTSCPKRALDPHGKFTDFLVMVDQHLSENEIDSTFAMLAQSFSDARSHIFIHCARYFAYQKGNYVKSLEITRKALDLNETDVYFSDTTCTEDVVLSLSSHLINCRLDSGPEMPFSEVQSLALDSIRLSKRAQEKQRLSRMTGELVYRAHPFCYEIQAQRLLLNGFFSIVCHKDSKCYFQQIEQEQYLAVKEAHVKILENIFCLEKKHDDDMLEHETLTEKELKKLNETKEEFIARYHPSGVPISNLKKLCPEASDVAFAWTIADCYVLQMEKTSELDYNTASDQQFDNFSLNHNLKIRHHDMWDRVWLLKNVANTEVYERLLSIILSCTSKLTKNFLEACVLLILLKPTKALTRALCLTNEWCQKFGYDFHAKFMHGAFHLAFSLSCSETDPKRRESLAEAKKAFASCEDLTVKAISGRRKRTLPGCNRLRFVLSKGRHKLDALAFLPRMQSYSEQQKYIRNLNCQTFTGYLDGANYLVCKELDSWVLHVPSKSLREEQFKQKRSITFAIALAYSGPTPIIF